MLLLVTATLFARSLRKGLDVELGFEPAGVVAAIVNLGPPHDYEPATRDAFFRTLGDRLRALPGVEDVGFSQYILVSGSRSTTNLRGADAPDGESVNTAYSSVDPGFLQTMRFELVAGRGFTEADDAESTPVAVVNRTLAESLFPGRSAVGGTLHGFGSEGLRIVGVVENGRYVSVTEGETAFAFFAYAQTPRSSMAVHLRAPGREAAALRAIRDEVRRLDPDVAVSSAARLDRVVWSALFPQRFAAQLVGLFGLVGLVLSAMGVYGVLTFHVASRSREFGIRRALGAGSPDVVRSVLGRGVLLATGGCLAGALVGAAVARALEGFLVGVEPLDPVTFLTVPAVLLLVALLAAAPPALRAVTVEPVSVLREE